MPGHAVPRCSSSILSSECTHAGQPRLVSHSAGAAGARANRQGSGQGLLSWVGDGCICCGRPVDRPRQARTTGHSVAQPNQPALLLLRLTVAPADLLLEVWGVGVGLAAAVVVPLCGRVIGGWTASLAADHRQTRNEIHRPAQCVGRGHGRSSPLIPETASGTQGGGNEARLEALPCNRGSPQSLPCTPTHGRAAIRQAGSRVGSVK